VAKIATKIVANDILVYRKILPRLCRVFAATSENFTATFAATLPRFSVRFYCVFAAYLPRICRIFTAYLSHLFGNLSCIYRKFAT
jgi:hypothetical protein